MKALHTVYRLQHADLRRNLELEPPKKTRYPKSGNGRRRTITELRAIPPDWRVGIIADSNA